MIRQYTFIPGNIILNSFIIRPRRSLRYWVSLLGLVAVLLLLLLFINRGNLDAGLSFWFADGGLATQELRGRNAELQEKILILEQNSQVDKLAAALLQEQLIDSQEDNFRLRKDLEFYKGIIDVKGGRNSPIIHGMRIKPLARDRSYRLELILLHITNTDKVFEGMLNVVVEGMRDSSETRLSLNEIGMNLNYAVSLRNFQRIENDFILPENFHPHKILVTITMENEEDAGFEDTFDWPLTENGETADVG